jgi:hypothetical protein
MMIIFADCCLAFHSLLQMLNKLQCVSDGINNDLPNPDVLVTFIDSVTSTINDVTATAGVSDVYQV